jgi:hypothetical protein
MEPQVKKFDSPDKARSQLKMVLPWGASLI